MAYSIGSCPLARAREPLNLAVATPSASDNISVMPLLREEELFTVAQKASIYDLTYREREIVSAIYKYISQQRA